jgi:hypothetical protein
VHCRIGAAVEVARRRDVTSHRVPSSVNSVAKICTAGVRRSTFFCRTAAEGCGGATGARVSRSAGSVSSSNKSGAQARRRCHST